MMKYDFSIQTREGQKIERLVIAGHDQANAEHKLLQMYRYCTVLSCIERHPDIKHGQTTSVQEILSLISK
jgi:hypothetical protein